MRSTSLYFAFVIWVRIKADIFRPEQIHLSFGDNAREIVVMWSTREDPAVSEVYYGTHKTGLTSKAEGSRRQLVNGLLQSQTIHRVKLKELVPELKYWYLCGSEKGWSRVYSFITMKNHTDWSPRLAVYGDLGYRNAMSLPFLTSEVQEGNLDAILHVGDFAYDFHSEGGRVGDNFMRQIEPLAARVPYMVSVGNHEMFRNFTNYRVRFSMPGYEDNMWYSYKIGPALIISLSTEVYFFPLSYGVDAVSRQHSWFESVLKEANLEENRKRWPWIITLGHRPMYCSNNNIRDCAFEEGRVRAGMLLRGRQRDGYGLERLLYNYGVDLAFWAHQHCYERMWPVFNHEVFNGSVEEPYRNPRSTVHITTGSAGNQERVLSFRDRPRQWSAFRSSDYGYTRLIIHNRTHLYLEQISVDKSGDVIDNIWIVKNRHGPFPTLFPYKCCEYTAEQRPDT